MKKLLIAGAGFTLALSLLWVGFISAANVRSGQSPHVMSDEVINGTLYAAGSDVKVEGIVQGDLFCAGQNVEITGEVEGDVLCAGQNVTVSGHVHGDVRVAGQLTTLRGKVDGSTTMLGQNVDVDEAATVGRDATILGQQVNLAGTIARDVESLGSSFTSKAKIGRDLDVTSETVKLENGTDIAGMFMYVSHENATVDSGAKIAGKTEHKIPETKQQGPEIVSPAAYFSSVIFSFSSFLMIGVVLLVATPRLMHAATNAIKASPLGTIGAGFAGLFVPPFVAAMLLVTIIGIPLGLVILLAWIIGLMIGLVFTSQVVGQLIISKLKWQDAWQQFASLVLGLFVLFLGALLPFVGPFVIMAAVIWGLGSLVYLLIKRRGAGPLVQHKEAKK